ncbi:hypothetical protein ACVDG3_19080 [Meridianimarinicoccus sp. RP-17]
MLIDRRAGRLTGLGNEKQDGLHGCFGEWRNRVRNGVGVRPEGGTENWPPMPSEFEFKANGRQQRWNALQCECGTGC